MRERIELVEGILKNNRGEYENMVSEEVKNVLILSNTQYGNKFIPNNEKYNDNSDGKNEEGMNKE